MCTRSLLRSAPDTVWPCRPVLGHCAVWDQSVAAADHPGDGLLQSRHRLCRRPALCGEHDRDDRLGALERRAEQTGLGIPPSPCCWRRRRLPLPALPPIIWWSLSPSRSPWPAAWPASGRSRACSPPSRAAPPRASGLALVNTIGTLGGFFGPNIVGTLKGWTGGYGLAMVALGGGQLLSAVIVLAAGRTLKPHQQAATPQL